MNYTTRANVENYLNRTFTEVQTAEFDNYLLATEAYINNHCGYNNETTTSGMLQEFITREKVNGKIDNYGNLVIDVGKPPINFDSAFNPFVTLVEYNFGGIFVPLQTTVNNTVAPQPTNVTLLSVSENRRKIIYPSIYFLPYLPQVTPTAKMNLYSLRDTKFWVDISYLGGYQTLPLDVVQAANIICGDMLTQRDNPNFAQSIRQGSYSIDFFARSNAGGTGGRSETRALIKAQEMLDPYVRYTW